MEILFLIGSVLASYGVFAFFGLAFQPQEATIIPQMFDLMLGGKKQYELYGIPYTIDWKVFPELTALFVIQMVIIALSFVSVFFYFNKKINKTIKFIPMVASGVLAIVGGIISLMIVLITSKDSPTDLQIGIGPIIYSVIEFVSVALIVIPLVVKLFKTVDEGETYESKNND